MTQQQTVIGAEATLFSELFQQGRFDVPWYQRYYDWKSSDVQALLHDIDNAIQENRSCYFLGALILIEVGHQKWEINDGQQRMITISLICAALCRRFAREAKESQREGLALRILFDLEANSTWILDNAYSYTPRITPPQNNETQYYQMIRGYTIGTNGPLTTAWAEIDKFFSSMSFEKSKQYFDFLIGKLEVACLWIPPSIDPNSVYETINVRGKKLDDLDLIRNYLYSHFNTRGDTERRSSVHNNLERIRILIPRTKSNKRASEYMRCHLQCRFGFLRKDNFYREAREAIRNQKDKKGDETEPLADYIFDLTEQIGAPELLGLFHMMTVANPDPESLQSFEVASGTRNSRRNLAVFLRELRGYTVTQPLVFAMLTRYIRESDGRKRKRVARIVNKNLGRLATFVLRTAFVAPKFEPSRFEEKFSDYAKDIATDDDIPDAEFASFLRDCDRLEHGVLDDSKFYDAMIEASMTGTAKIKQFLLGINGDLQSDARLLNERSCTIEHILPKSPQHWSGWTGFDSDSGADWVQRIGNLTLMGPTDNRPGAKYNASFAKKRENYEDSGIALTRKLSNYVDWTPACIEARQKEMVKRAIRVWAFV